MMQKAVEFTYKNIFLESAKQKSIEENKNRKMITTGKAKVTKKPKTQNNTM